MRVHIGTQVIINHMRLPVESLILHSKGKILKKAILLHFHILTGQVLSKIGPKMFKIGPVLYKIGPVLFKIGP